jgi:FkbM family methyltransferase
MNRPIRLVDVGAAIGDTVLFVDANCSGQVSEYICVDGDQSFFGYLEQNLSGFSNVTCIFSQLSRSGGLNRSLVRTQPGTASAQGEDSVPTASLDTVLGSHDVGPVDVIKIDVDGFDGEVLAGAVALLQRDHPGVIFEWHPILCERTGNDRHEAFRSLVSAGYHRFIWFDKFGVFSHFMFRYDVAEIDAMADHCLADVSADWHYDVIALHDSSQITEQALSNLRFAAARTSRY